MKKNSSILEVSSSPDRMSAMEGLRAYAAWIVYLVHLFANYIPLRIGADFFDNSVLQVAEVHPMWVAYYWLWSSNYGVDIFFLLSGFLIAGMVEKENFQYLRFLWHRFMRIYPTLVVSTLVYVVYGVVFRDGVVWISGIVSTFLLLNGIPGYDFPSINVVTWSLFFEFAFYFCFPILWKLCNRNLGLFVLISLMILVPLSMMSGGYMRFLMFVGGVILKVLSNSDLSKIRNYFSEWMVLIIYLISTTLFVFTKNFIVFIPLYIIPAKLLVDRALNVDGALSRFLSMKPLRYFGNISFSFYMFHHLALAIAKQILGGVNIDSNIVYLILFIVLSLMIALTLSVLCFIFVEKQYFKNKDNLDKVFNRIASVASRSR